MKRQFLYSVCAWAALLIPTQTLGQETKTDNPLMWSLNLPKESKVSFRGVVSMDNAGSKPANMMYPAPNAVGLLAAVLTHALINDAARSVEKNRIETEANKVLSPYSDILDAYTHQDLASQAISKTGVAGNHLPFAQPENATNTNHIIVNALPVFSMTQDQKGLVLDNAIALTSGGAKDKNPPGYLIRVINDPQTTEEITDYWKDADGKRLKDESARLLAMSIDIALAQRLVTGNDDDKKFKTVRYLEGGTLKIERAQVLSRQCGRLLIKNLKGVLMSVPESAPEESGDAGQCEKKSG